MGIGKRIKEARENLGLTQNELGELIGVTGSAITNYEKETSHPKETVMYKLIETLHVDANYLFQDVVNIKKNTDSISLSEIALIKKYRSLDEKAKDIIDTLLDKVYIYSSEKTYNVAAKGNANKQIDSDTAKNLAKAADKAPNLADKEFL